MPAVPFRDRREAGQRLAERLAHYADRPDVVVLALPRGGVPVAFEVARSLRAPLDVFIVRKLGAPGHPEFAMGAIAAGGARVLNADVVEQLGVSPATIEQIVERERAELERRDRAYHRRGQKPAVSDKTIILIDDGLATGSTMEAAIAALRQLDARRIIAAAPVGALDSCGRLSTVADAVVCMETPEPFNAVGLWYRNFEQTTDAEVVDLLEQAQAQQPRAARPHGATDLDVVRSRAVPLDERVPNYDALIDAVKRARIVLIGEASHGTHEFYRERAFITERLIAEAGFSALAVEADWRDAYRVNRYVRGASADADATQALTDFARFPTWMWRNLDVVEFVVWLRAHNETQPPDQRTGFYGIDLYSLRTSTQAVLAYLSKIDPEAARIARSRYSCFDHFGDELNAYGYATESGWSASCEDEVTKQLIEMQRRRADYASRDGRVAGDDYFFAEQNARLVKNAEQYYRTMFRGRHESWNLRDRHMADTVGALLAFLSRSGDPARLVVWAHNSHLGDARATEMGRAGELNVGQLLRERFGGEVVSIGFTTYSGTVTAASEWDGPAERKFVRPALADSYELLFHQTATPRFLLPLGDPDLARVLATPRFERAIGVIYRPDTERASHYFRAALATQFDYVLHFDQTRAVEPLERTAEWESPEPAETCSRRVVNWQHWRT